MSTTQVNAIELMEAFISSGSYQRMKQLEADYDNVKKTIYVEMDMRPELRLELGKVLIERQTVRQFNTDRVALNRYLLESNVLLQLGKFNDKGLSENDLAKIVPAQLPQTHYIRYSPNKEGKSVNVVSVTDFRDLDLERLCDEYLIIKVQYKALEKQYEQLKNQMLADPELIAKKKLATKYGSVSMLENKAQYDLVKVASILGADAILENVIFDSTDLEILMQIGVLDKSEVAKYRVEVGYDDARVQVTDLDSKSRGLEGYYRRIDELKQLFNVA